VARVGNDRAAEAVQLSWSIMEISDALERNRGQPRMS
jgi:hypothetical protein